MKPSILALAVLTLLAPVFAQEPSQKTLRTLLHAEVTYANDGRLRVMWPFRAAGELNAFKCEPKPSAEIVAGEGLVIRAEGENGATVTFKELEFLQPCKATFELLLENTDTTAVFVLGDPAKAGSGINVGVNARIFSDSDTRVDFIGRWVSAKPDGRPKFEATIATPAKWIPISVEIQKTMVALQMNRVPRHTFAASLGRFTFTIVTYGGAATIRNLALDTQVDRDSIRKLYRSVTAASESKPAKSRVSAFSANAWMKVASERADEEPGDAVLVALDALPSDARAAVHAGFKESNDSDYHGALACFEKAAGMAPNAAVVLWLAGISAGDTDAPAKKMKYLESAVAADAKFATAWLALGETHAENDADAAALAAFDKAEVLAPADPWVHVSRAHLHLARSRLPEARKDVARALGKRPESAGLDQLSKGLDRLAAKPWTKPFEKKTACYSVETTISSKCAADLARRLEVYRRHLEKAFPLKVNQTERSNVWVFDSEEEYQSFASSIGNSHENTLGLYVPLLKTLLLTSKVSSETTQHILFHEAFHQYLDLAVGRAPIWLNEGLAEYYGATTFDVSDKATEGGRVAMRLPALRGKLLGSATLMMLTPSAFMNANGAALHYAQSWALVHFFKNTTKPGFRKAFDAYCAAVIAGKTQADAMTAFANPSVPSGTEVDAEFEDYVRTVLLR